MLARSTDWLCQYSSLVALSFIVPNNLADSGVLSLLLRGQNAMPLTQGFTEFGAGVAGVTAGVSGKF